MIPKPTEPLILRQGTINPLWWTYFRSLAPEQPEVDLEAQIRDLAKRVAEIGTAPGVVGQMSVRASSQPDGAIVLTLVNDQIVPPARSYYGVDESGQRGFHALPTGGILPVVTGEIVSGQPVFVYADDGSLIYSEIA